MSKSDKKLILTAYQDFSTSKLVSYLNDKHEGKRTGTPFTMNDIQQYIRRGKLPVRIGNHPIEVIENEEIGVKVIRVHFNKTAKRKGK